jgi:hypothetical protein
MGIHKDLILGRRSIGRYDAMHEQTIKMETNMLELVTTSTASLLSPRSGNRGYKIYQDACSVLNSFSRTKLI